MPNKRPRKRPLTIEEAKKVLNSKEMEDKLREIEKMAENAGDEPDCPDGLILGPKNELANKRLDKTIERDMEESMDEEDD